MSRPDARLWLEAMEEEMKAHLGNQTWTVVERPPGSKVIPSMWVYSIKRDAHGNIVRYKARLVAKGCVQTYGVDFDEVYAPTSRQATLRFMEALSAKFGLCVAQYDVETAFLNATLNSTVHMSQAPGFQEGSGNMVCLLNKSLYGLRQAPREWYLKLRSELENLGFKVSYADAGMYVLDLQGDTVVLIAWVDDLRVYAKLSSSIAHVKSRVSSLFKIREIGESNTFIGMQILRDQAAGTVKLSQAHTIPGLLEKFGMTACKPASTPLPLGVQLTKTSGPQLDTQVFPYCSLVGSLLYLSICTRPDLAQAVGVLSRFMSRPEREHWDAALHVLRYLKGSPDLGIVYSRDGDDMVGWVDADYGGDKTTRRSTTGCVFMMSGGAVAWTSRLQRTVAVSTVESEYMAASSAVKEALWFRILHGDVGLGVPCMTIMCDNLGCIANLNNPIVSDRTKHIDIQHKFASQRVELGHVVFQHCGTEHMIADMLTKTIPPVKFVEFRTAMGMR